MTEVTALTIFIVMKYLALICVVAGVVYLAAGGKEGWGWLIFIGWCITSTSYKYKPDTH